jgi:membrane-associated phospholipid phosphatase
VSPSLHADTGHHRRTARAHPQLPGGPRRAALRLGGGAVALWALISLLGLVLTHVVSPNGAPSWDAGVESWFAARRSSTLNTVTSIGSGIANTETAIAVTVILVVLLRWRLGRWYESWVVVAAIAGELLVFLAITATVHRARPSVPQLDIAPPTSSFPSGHTAAAVALYGCVAVLLVRFWPGVESRIARWLFFAIPVIVGMSRLYRGMHFPSDVVFGAVGGGLWLLIVVTTLLPARHHPGHTRRPSTLTPSAGHAPVRPASARSAAPRPGASA